jgi:DnaD/phage-associated family protein
MSAGAPFEGFVTGGAATTLPAQFFVELLPEIDDEAELRVTLYALYAIGRRKGPLRAVRASELRGESPLVRALERLGGAAAVAPALERAVRRGSLLVCPLDDGDALYFVNSEGGRRNLLRVQSGAIPAPGVPERAPPAERPGTVARAYEQEIGTLTPSVAEALAEAEERYPEPWIVDALREAARSNARSWRYAEAVLRRWEREGRGDATAEGDHRNPARRALGAAYERVVRRE